MWANIDEFNNNDQRALERYKKIAPESLATYQGYIPFLFKNQKYDTIVTYAPTLDKHFANNPSLQLLLALSFKKTGNPPLCNQRMIELNKKYPSRSDIALHAAQAHVERQQKEEALAVIDTYLNKGSHGTNTFLFYFLKGQIYSQMNQVDNALKNIEECLALRPSYSNAWLMRAALEEQQGHIQPAIEGYSHFLNLTGNANSSIHNHLTSLMIRQTPGESPQNLALLPINASNLDRAIMFFSQKDTAQALLHTNKYLTEHPHSIQAKLLKLQIYILAHNFDRAITFLRQEIAHEVENGLWYKTLYVLKDRGIPLKMLAQTFKELTIDYPNSIHPHLYAADLLLRSTHPARALPYLKKAEKLSPLPAQQALILYQQALIAYDKKDFKAARATLGTIIERDPSFYPAHNLLAYLLAKKSTDRTQAHQLIDIALAHNPHNHHYRDTKAYILYKDQQYALAEKIFEELSIPCHTDVVILKHLAKTYIKQQKHKEADAIFKKIAALATDKQNTSALEKKT
jgi:tetratricopeptide (TPR) repeat protein